MAVCLTPGCSNKALRSLIYCLTCSIANTEADLPAEKPESEREYEYQVSCFTCSHDRYVRLRRKQATLLSLVGMRCGYCGGWVTLEKLLPRAQYAP